eukprot:4138461-Amphidinium_carterae.1
MTSQESKKADVLACMCKDYVCTFILGSRCPASAVLAGSPSTYIVCLVVMARDMGSNHKLKITDCKAWLSVSPFGFTYVSHRVKR